MRETKLEDKASELFGKFFGGEFRVRAVEKKVALASLDGCIWIKGGQFYKTYFAGRIFLQNPTTRSLRLIPCPLGFGTFCKSREEAFHTMCKIFCSGIFCNENGVEAPYVCFENMEELDMKMTLNGVI